MISVIGLKRILVLATLAAVNLLFAAGLYLYSQPQQAAKQAELASLQGQIASKQGDIERIQIAFDQLEVQQGFFDRLRSQGFFGNQGRREAELVLGDIQNKSGVIKAVANIQPGQVREDEEAQKADHKILESVVELNIEALDDVDIYRYIYLLKNYFPGHITVDDLLLERKGQVNDAVLRGIASGQSPPLIRARLSLIWRTMIPQSQIVGGGNG